MAGIRDVAKQAGVSPATVSRAFAAPELINEQTQKRVFEAARLLDYQPPRLRSSASREGRDNTGAKSRPPLSSLGRPHVGFSDGQAPLSSASPTSSLASVRDAIGFQFFTATVNPNDTIAHNTFYTAVLAGAQAEAAALGLHLLIHSTDRHGLSNDMPRMVQEKAIGGMLLVGTADPAVLHAFAAHLKEIILVDHRDESGGPFESIVSDGFNGAYTATRYLIDLGHKRIGFLTETGAVPTFQDRLRGFVCAQFEAGLSVRPDWVLHGSENEEERLAQFLHLLQKPQDERPTALLCANDHNALLALRACRETGLHVPGDISLIGFDDVYFSAHTDPPLTTVRVDKEYMGRFAVRRLFTRLHAEQSELTGEQGRPLPVCHQIPVSLVIRKSCRAV